uniref:Uncharacterized protein n=1 Tax=Caulobacter sp. (strain K31) TaxID=366602 RepID=B0T633_CAUSK
MTTYHDDRTPFMYAIGWTKQHKWYLGIRYGKGCHPSDLWTTYFTSSERVAAFRAVHGEPDHVEVLFTGDREEVVQKEADYIREFDIHRCENWLNLGAGGAAFYLDELAIEKLRRPKARRHGRMLSSSELAEVEARKAHGYRRLIRPEDRRPRRSKTYEWKGECLTLNEWVNKYQMCSVHQARMRLQKGWTIEKAVTTAPRPRTVTMSP